MKLRHISDPEAVQLAVKSTFAREISKREITSEEAKELIEKGQIGPFDDLIAKKTGNPYTAILYLKKNQRIGISLCKARVKEETS